MICERIGDTNFKFVETDYGIEIFSQRRSLNGRFAPAQKDYLVFGNPVLRTKLQLGIAEEKIDLRR